MLLCGVLTRFFLEFTLHALSISFMLSVCYICFMPEIFPDLII